MSQQSTLSHWIAIEKLSLEQAGLLIAGVDPFNVEGSFGSAVARGKVYSLAIAQASQRAWEYAHRYIHSSISYEFPKECVDIWELSDSLPRFLPSMELRNSVEGVLSDPANVPLLVSVDPWYSETISGGALNEWAEMNEIDSSFQFADEQRVAIKEYDHGRVIKWRQKEEDREERLELPLQRHPESAGQPPVSDTEGRWPWGVYETKYLGHLDAAVRKFWLNYDPSDTTTAPTNAQVKNWLLGQGVTERVADVIATMIRVDGLPPGPRRQ